VLRWSQGSGRFAVDRVSAAAPGAVYDLKSHEDLLLCCTDTQLVAFRWSGSFRLGHHTRRLMVNDRSELMEYARHRGGADDTDDAMTDQAHSPTPVFSFKLPQTAIARGMLLPLSGAVAGPSAPCLCL
jgi:hypothetical protein